MRIFKEWAMPFFALYYLKAPNTGLCITDGSIPISLQVTSAVFMMYTCAFSSFNLCGVDPWWR